jgi:hypothetical protein
MSIKKILLLVIIYFSALTVYAEYNNKSSTVNPFFFKFNNFRCHFLWGADFMPTGADLTFGYTGFRLFQSVDTIFHASIGAGYEGFETYRDVDYTPNTEIDYSAGRNKNLEFNSPNFQWETGIRQGIIYNDRLDRNLIEVFLFYRGRMDFYLKGRHFWGTGDARIEEIEDGHKTWQQQYQGSDAYGIFGTSFITGLTLDNLYLDKKTKAYDGLYIETSFEISPYLKSVRGATDFYRLNFSGKFFKTLYEARPSSEKNVFTVYMGNYFSIDYADAKTYMPLYVMQTFGGTDPHYGLAYSVRGFEKFSWDTQLKIVDNIELRFNLPVIYRIKKKDCMELVPGVLTFFDIGYGSGYWGDTSGADGGIIASAGTGVYLNIFNFKYLRLYASFPFIGERLDGAPVNFNFDIDLQF